MDVEMNKPGPNGTPGAGGFASPGPAYAAAAAPTPAPTQTIGIVFRAIAVALTLISAIVMGIAKETIIVNLYDSYTGVLVATVPVPAKSVQYSAYVYFIAANVIVFAYSSLSMAVSIGRRGTTGGLGISSLLPILDVVMVALLFSCNGATAAITLLAERGNDKAGWGKFCNTYNNYCGRVTAALVLSMIAAVAYVKLLIFSIITLNKRQPPLY